MTAGSGARIDGATLSPAPGSGAAVYSAEPQGARRWPWVLAVVAGILAAYCLIAVIGVRADAREERILGSLTPVFYWLRDNGAATQEWLQNHRRSAGAAGVVLLLSVGVAALVRRGRAGAPVVLLSIALALALWGQVEVQGDATTAGTWLYLVACALALVLGIWVPLRRLATFPPFPPAAPVAAGTAPAGSGLRPITLSFGRECLLVLALTLIALISRTWALTELYDFFDLEMIDSMVQARTWSGYAGYLDFGFVQNNGGAVHLLPAELIFRLFGTSIFTLRMTAVLWSITAIPLMYTLARRIGGVTAGIFASIFLITAPEQLFWARNENVFFSGVAVCALVTAHLALWMVERLSPLAVLCNALWMPWCRWFYSASMVAFLIPITTALHAMIFVRRLWRKAWYVVPILAVGLGLWIVSLSVMKAALHNWEWRFVDPSAVYGASAWRKQGEFADATLPQLVVLQAVSMSTNFAEVVRNMSYHTENFSHWCQRSQPAAHRTIMNVGLTLVVFVGLGYLLGQFPDRRAFLLLAWWGISVLPAILSREPADRRMAMVFPASQALAGVVLAAFWGIVLERGGRLAEWLARVALAVGIGAIALTNLASHLLMPINPVLYSDYPRFAKPLLEGSDALYTNIPQAFRTLMVFGNLDHFLERPICLQAVEQPRRWLATALDPQCAFDESVYPISVGAGAIDGLRRAYNPKRVSYLLWDDPVSAPSIALLQALHPDTPVERHVVPRAERTLVAMTVDVDDIAKLRAPTLRGAVEGDVLAGIPMQREPGGDTAGPPTVEGGILLDNDGWYQWRLDPPCGGATLTLDGQAVAADTPRPMLAGVHPFTLALPSAGGCTLPVQIVMDGVVPHHTEPVPAQRYVSRTVAALPVVQAPQVDAVAGYPGPSPFIQFKHRPVDFGVDAQGNISVLLREQEGFRLHRYDRNGKEFANGPVEVPLTINPGTLAVAPDGTTAILVQKAIQLYDTNAKAIGSWEHTWFVWETQLAFWNGLLIANIHHRDSIAVFTRQGDLVREFTTFEGGPGKFFAPMAFAIGADGDLLVQQLDGLALRFKLEGEGFNPVFVEEFRVDAAAPGSGFDGSDRMLVPSEQGLRMFAPGGRRLMASDPKRDPSQQPFGNSVRVRRGDGRLLMLDPDRQTLWKIPG